MQITFEKGLRPSIFRAGGGVADGVPELSASLTPSKNPPWLRGEVTLTRRCSTWNILFEAKNGQDPPRVREGQGVGMHLSNSSYLRGDFREQPGSGWT